MRAEKPEDRKARSRRGRLIFVVALFALTIPSIVEFYTDWLWFGETGYQGVFLRKLTTQVTFGAVAGVLAFGALFINIRVALRGFVAHQVVVNTREGPIAIAFDPRRARAVTTLAAGLVAVLLGLFASGHWLTWLMFWNGQPFGEADPVLGHDISYYVFRLPMLDALSGFLLTVVVLSALAAGAIYVLTGSLARRSDYGISVSNAARRHLAVLGGLCLLVLGFAAYLDVPQVLHSPGGVIHGATNVDVAVRIPALRVLTLAALLGAALSFYQAFAASWWPMIAAVATYIVVAAGGSVTASLVQRFVVAPNEQVRETPYIEHNIAATRKAFALDKVEEREVSGDAVLSRADIEANDATLGNVRLWDREPLLQTFAQIQEIRTYYDFVSVHNDRYIVDGEYRQIMLSARELNSESLPNRNWINERLTFTHGYGVTLGPVNQVTPEGLPVLFIKDLPPQSSVDLEVEQPAIYYGQRSSDHVFVATKAREFHYPKGEDNVYTTYDGSGGVPLSNMIRRALFSVRFKSVKVLLSDDITNDSRVLFHRRLSERVRRIAPFLQYDANPYLLISNGRLFWMQDAYTASSRYPYSTPISDGSNYVRNSVKATVDAYHGTAVFYIVDESDPIAATLGKIFPDLFRPLTDMPEDIRGRLRYPEGIFTVQAGMYGTYHMTNPAVFYNKEDQWDIPSIGTEPRAEPMQPYYTIMKLPGEEAPEFVQMLPFTPARKDNLASWMVARSDGAHYGRMLVFQFPKQKVVFGPRQIVGRINQDQAIAPQITLWNQQGSEVLQGTLLVIPIEESLIYIRPLYLRSAGGRIPELKRVIVAHQNRIVMEETLENALDRLFPSGAQADRPASTTEIAATADGEAAASQDDPLMVRALEHYRRALKAQREGNWGLYGDEIQKLGDVLEQSGQKR
jgi:uncharacterized membrane protein (UPF0182 family)